MSDELLDPDGPLATAIRKNVAKYEDAPAMRVGTGWAGRIEGFCPVQGRGSVDELNWYFRARHDAWSFEVWREPFGRYGELPDGDPTWFAEGEYGDASWMPFSVAWQYIESSIATGRQTGWSMP